MNSRRRPDFGRGLIVCLTALALVTAALPEALAARKGGGKATDAREMRAREAFAAGRYEEAVDLFSKLYAEKLHPTYLRNIGRCHQNLSHPDQAIAAFRDYMRQARKLPASEREEVEGYIREMEALKERQAVAAAPPVAQPRPAPVPVPVPEPPVASPQSQPAGLNLQQTPPEPSAPVYERAWFWVVASTVVAAAVVGGLWATGVFKGGDDCPTDRVCK